MDVRLCAQSGCRKGTMPTSAISRSASAQPAASADGCPLKISTLCSDCCRLSRDLKWPEALIIWWMSYCLDNKASASCHGINAVCDATEIGLVWNDQRNFVDESWHDFALCKVQIRPALTHNIRNI